MRIIYNPRARISKGFGYVDFKDIASAREATSKHKKVRIQERDLIIDHAKPYFQFPVKHQTYREMRRQYYIIQKQKEAAAKRLKQQRKEQKQQQQQQQNNKGTINRNKMQTTTPASNTIKCEAIIINNTSNNVMAAAAAVVRATAAVPLLTNTQEITTPHFYDTGDDSSHSSSNLSNLNEKTIINTIDDLLCVPPFPSVPLHSDSDDHNSKYSHEIDQLIAANARRTPSPKLQTKSSDGASITSHESSVSNPNTNSVSPKSHCCCCNHHIASTPLQLPRQQQPQQHQQQQHYHRQQYMMSPYGFPAVRQQPQLPHPMSVYPNATYVPNPAHYGYVVQQQPQPQPQMQPRGYFITPYYG